jgi:hypothetical protein
MSMLGLDDGASIGRTALESLIVHLNLKPGSLGAPAPEVITAVRSLVGLRFPGDEGDDVTWEQFDSEARAHYTRIKAIDSTGLQLRLFLAYLSGYFHELRHAHDLSVTGYGQDALFLLLNIYQNLPAVLSNLAEWQVKHPGILIPLPVRRHEAFWPELSSDVIQVLVKYAEIDDRVRAMHESTAGASSSLSAIHLFEAVATDVQMDFIHELFGEEAVYEFSHLLLEGNKAPLYLQVRNYVHDVFSSRGFQGHGLGALINYLAWCALMGLTPRGSKLDQHVPATVIFEGLVEYVSLHCLRWDMETCSQTVHNYCDRWSLYYPEEMIEIYRKSTIGKRLESMERIPKTSAYEGAHRIARCYQAIVKSYDFLHQQIKLHPDFYFVGRFYAWNLLAGRLPAVFTRIHLSDQSHDFMTRGNQFLSSDQWGWMDMLSTTMRLLLKGRGQTADPVVEDIVFSQLTEQGWHGHQFEFDAWSSFSQESKS